MGEPSPIPFAQGQASGLSQLSGASPAQINVMADAVGALHVRPGIRAWESFGDTIPNESPVIGVYEWRSNVIHVCEDRSMWAMTAPGSFLSLGDLPGTGRPIFAYDQQRVVVTGGGAPMKWEGVGAASELAPGMTDPSGSPLALTAIAYNTQRFIGSVNSNAGYLQWTQEGPGAHDQWPIVGPFYAEAEASPDTLLTLYANANEVYAFGPESMQVYVADPNDGFVPAATVNVGCLVAASVINTDSDFAWLDNDHRFTQSNGREFKVLSSPGMAKDIANLAVTSDCWGARIKFEGFDLLVWSFPTEKRAIVVDRITNKWGEFRSTSANGEWIAWMPTAYYFSSARNVHLVGLSDGSIGELTMEASTDMGNSLRGFSRTGFMDNGTLNRKHCQRVQLQLRRDAAIGTEPTDARVEYRYRDNLGGWSASTAFPLGGSYEPCVDKWSQGVFRQRQHEISFTNANEFVLAGATMTLETLES